MGVAVVVAERPAVSVVIVGRVTVLSSILLIVGFVVGTVHGTGCDCHTPKSCTERGFLCTPCAAVRDPPNRMVWNCAKIWSLGGRIVSGDAHMDIDNQALEAVLSDLRDEGDELASIVEWLSERQLAMATPADGWDIRTTIGHLKWTDEMALVAIDDPEGFSGPAEGLVSDTGSDESDTYVKDRAVEAATGDFDFVLGRWASTRTKVRRAMRAAGGTASVRWLPGPVSVVSMATILLMETWAHGQDIRDALGLRPRATPRLRHIAALGVGTRDLAYHARGLEPPCAEFRIELTVPHFGASPDGTQSGVIETTMVFGPEAAGQRISGSALDFCLLVTRRRHHGDLELQVVGSEAEAWLSIAQVYVGPPGSGRRPGSR